MKNIKTNKAKQIKFSVLDKLTPEQVAIYFRESQNDLFDRKILDDDWDKYEKEYAGLVEEVDYVKRKSDYHQSNVFFGLMKSYQDQCCKIIKKVVAEIDGYENTIREIIINHGKDIIETDLNLLEYLLFIIKELLYFYYSNYFTYVRVPSKFYDSRVKTEVFEEMYPINHKQNESFFSFLDRYVKYQFDFIQGLHDTIGKMIDMDSVDGEIYEHEEYLEIKGRYDVCSSDIGRLNDDGFFFAKDFKNVLESDRYMEHLENLKKDKELFDYMKPDPIDVHMKKFDEKPKATYDMENFKIHIPDSEKFFEDDEDIEYLKTKDIECFSEEEYAKLEKGEKLEYDDDGNLL